MCVLISDPPLAYFPGIKNLLLGFCYVLLGVHAAGLYFKLLGLYFNAFKDRLPMVQDEI